MPLSKSPRPLVSAATPSPFLEPPGMATAACSHTKTSPEGYAATHEQSSAVRVQTMAGWEASVMLNDSRQEQVALRELWGHYFLSKMGFLKPACSRAAGESSQLCSLAGTRVPVSHAGPCMGFAQVHRRCSLHHYHTHAEEAFML